MAKRIMFVLAAALLVICGLYVRSLSSSSAHNQVSDIVRLDGAGTDTAAAMEALKTYVHSHMGTSVSFTLNGAYTRAVASAKAAAAAAAGTGNVYADAQKACSGHTDSVTQAKCNQAYIAAHLTSQPAPTPVPEPKLADYQYNLRSPLWTPDPSGALLLGAVAAVVIGVWPKRRRR